MAPLLRPSLAAAAALVALVAVWPHLVAAGPASRRCSGTVLAPGGAPIEGASVTLWRQAGGDPGAGPVARTACARTWTAADGSFALLQEDDGTPAPAVEGLTIEAFDFHAAELPIAERSGRVVLQPIGVIEGVVVDARGQPVAGATVVAVDRAASVQRVGRARWDGSFRLRVPHAGTYRVSGQLADGRAIEPCDAVRAGATCELLVR